MTLTSITHKRDRTVFFDPTRESVKKAADLFFLGSLAFFFFLRWLARRIGPKC